ncbi:MAG TPA: nucleotidyltransferase domain-containing protein [Bacteroidetes bacterium]|nr:nucleotidyltransferase domain-containing protein [Bacteroidota bacterium]
MNYGLKEKVIKKINLVFSNYPKIEKAILYGSRAKGNFTNGSDIDLTLIGNDLEFNDLLKILSDIDQLMLPYKFDICLSKSITDIELLDHIKRVGKYFYIKGSNGCG